MRAAVEMLRQRAPDLEVDGEMHGDAALIPRSAATPLPGSRLKGAANLVICPSLDAANIAFNLLKNGRRWPAWSARCCSAPRCRRMSLTPSVTARGIVNMTALAVVEAERLAGAARG